MAAVFLNCVNPGKSLMQYKLLYVYSGLGNIHAEYDR